MDILIKGMEMPKDDLHGIVLYFEKDGFKEARSCYNTLLIEGITAIPVPEHGRLIDATELEASDAILIGEDAWNMVHNAPTVVEASNGTDN